MMKEFIESIPKAELEVHLEGMLEPEMIQAFAKRNRIKITLPENPASYQEIYQTGISVLITEKDFYELTLSYLEKAAAQNIRHTEISFNAEAHIERGISLDTVMSGINQAMQEAEKKYSLSVQLILCFMRELSVASAQEILLKALAYKESIVAIGLDLSESKEPPEKFTEIFARAREYGFMTIASAGETAPPEYIWQAIDKLRVSRVGYGIRCTEDNDLISRMNMTRIPISVCPVANTRLGYIKTMKVHPLKKMYDEGLCVTVNSSKPALYAANLNDNYFAAQTALHFDKNEIYELAKNSFLASFLASDKIDKLLAELERFRKQN